MFKVGDLVTVANQWWQHVAPTQEADQKSEEELAKTGKYTGPSLFEQKVHTSWETGVVVDIVEKDEERVVYRSGKSKITEHRSLYHVLTSNGEMKKTQRHLLKKLE